MSKLRVHFFSVSIDGYGAGPDQSVENPLGVGGEALHTWIIATRRALLGRGGSRTANQWLAESQLGGIAMGGAPAARRRSFSAERPVVLSAVQRAMTVRKRSRARWHAST